MAKAKIGDERYMVESITAADAERVARQNGWDGNADGLLDHCDAGAEAAVYTYHATLDAAVAHARASLANEPSLFGACIIDHDVYEQATDDRGRRVEGGSWETQRRFEVATDGECIEVTS